MVSKELGYNFASNFPLKSSALKGMYSNSRQKKEKKDYKFCTLTTTFKLYKIPHKFKMAF